MVDINDVKFKNLEAKHVGALKTLFDTILPVPNEAFYRDLSEGLSKGYLANRPTDKLTGQVAIFDGHLIGGIVITTMNLAEEAAREGGQPLIDCDLVELQTPETKGAYILMMGVAPKYRRCGVGGQLIFEGLKQVLTDAYVKACFLHTNASEQGVNDFYWENEFECLGVVPKYYTVDGQPVDAKVWVRAFHNAQVAVYKPQVKGQPVDLTQKPLTKPWRLPGWMWTLFLQFGLPLCCVGALFAISYLLVLLGPLKGISSRFIKDEGGDFSADTTDFDGEYDEEL